jgi:IclR family transcriptional regulator, KDG regulon repressor
MSERTHTSIDKAFEVCEALSRAPRGLSLGELARMLQLPPPTLHRTLTVLRRRGYVRQDEESQRYGLTLKMLDLSFQLLGRSELRLHAYPLLREYVLRSGNRSFLAIPSHDEVTYIWAGSREVDVAMRTVYGREVPARSTSAPVQDYTGREVARVGVFAHKAEDGVLTGEYQRACRELARQISVRLGHLPAVSLGLPA